MEKELVIYISFGVVGGLIGYGARNFVEWLSFSLRLRPVVKERLETYCEREEPTLPSPQQIVQDEYQEFLRRCVREDQAS